jgi:hypothetical protein
MNDRRSCLRQLLMDFCFIAVDYDVICLVLSDDASRFMHHASCITFHAPRICHCALTFTA